MHGTSQGCRGPQRHEVHHRVHVPREGDKGSVHLPIINNVYLVLFELPPVEMYVAIGIAETEIEVMDTCGILHLGAK